MESRMMMNIGIDVTKIVKYVCIAGVAIVAVIFCSKLGIAAIEKTKDTDRISRK